MYKGASRFQLSQPTRQFFIDHSGSWGDEEPDPKSLQPQKHPLARLWEGTRRIGVEFYLRTKVGDLEVAALLFQLSKLDCVPEADKAFLGLIDERISKEEDQFRFRGEEKEQFIKMICSGLAIFDTRPPPRHFIVNW